MSSPCESLCENVAMDLSYKRNNNEFDTQKKWLQYFVDLVG